ncbi:MAG: AMP-binding protein [Rhodobacter sp.]|nr:AMP-binding protein [Rhodobacter sp.]
MTIDTWIRDAAARWPDRPALEFDGETLSYAGMQAAVEARVLELRAGGVGRGDRVAWYGLNHAQVFVLLFACARLGAILVPLNWRLAEAEVAAIVANASPKVLFHDAHFAAQAQALPGVVTVAVDAPVPASETPGTGRGQAGDPILLVYTSGSTGRPKGAVLTQDSLICNAAMSVEAHAMTPDDVVLNVLPLFHVGGLNILPTPAFSIGATVVLHDRFDAARTCAALSEVTLAITVPTVLQAVMDCENWATADLSRLRGLSIGSTDVPTSLIENVHACGVPLIQIYGATETGPFAIYQQIGEAMTSVGSIGRAGSGCRIRLMRDGVEAGAGEPGEIWVKGDNVLHEYWRDPALTAEFLVDGWFRTGDVAMRDTAGLYWFKDRIKHMVISGGENIYPAEIERILREVPGISEVSVVGRPDPKWGEVPVAVVVASRPLGKPEVLAPLAGRLARFKHPKDVVFVDALPRNAMGKVVAADVRAMIAARSQPAQ